MKLRIVVGLAVLSILLTASAMSGGNATQRHLVVSKQRLQLYMVDGADTIWRAPIGCGKNIGDKQRKGDNRTPEGTFRVKSRHKASHWTHDFSDGAGDREGAYGDWFIRLDVPRFSGIGIHGTCFPESIGTRCSEGCIRLRNDDLNKLKKLVFVGMTCTIEPDKRP